MRISIFGVLVLFSIGITSADLSQQEADGRLLPVQRPDINDYNHDNAMELLATLQELHQSLISQIALLESMQKTSDMTHLVLHYTAQKDNIEREISLIKSIEASPAEGTRPRHIKDILPEEKIFKSIFKKNRNPSSSEETFNDDNVYSLPYPPYYVSSQAPQYVYAYIPPKPDYPYPNDLIENTFSGYQPQDHHHHHQMFMPKEKPPQNYQMLPEVQPNSQKYTPTPEVPLKPAVPQRQSEPSKNATRVPPHGQKPETLIYYPGAVANNTQQRPTIVNRFGQAFDRFGQVISNLTNRQPLRPMFGSNANDKEKPSNRTINIRSRLSNEENMKARKLEHRRRIERGRKPDDRRSKLRWVSV